MCRITLRFSCDIDHLYMSLVDELGAIHLMIFWGTVGFRRLKALKSHSLTSRITWHLRTAGFSVSHNIRTSKFVSIKRPPTVASSPILPTSPSTKYRNHGDRIDRAVRAGFPEATAHIPQLQSEKREEQEGGQGRTTMVQGRWTGIPDAEDCDWGDLHRCVLVPRRLPIDGNSGKAHGGLLGLLEYTWSFPIVDLLLIERLQTKNALSPVWSRSVAVSLPEPLSPPRCTVPLLFDENTSISSPNTQDTRNDTRT